MDEDFETLSVRREGEHVLVVELNRPEVYNALNTQMAYELLTLWNGMYVDAEDVRCIVLTGSGDKAFCAGGDLKERNGMTAQAWQRQHALFEQMSRAMQQCPVPILAAINGVAYGGGCEITLAADFVYAAERARFALPEVTLGIMPGAMGTQNMPRATGTRRAMEVILTGKPFSAADGYEWGMINKICDNDALLEEAVATAQTIADNAPIATRQAKKSVTMAGQIDTHNGFAFELEAYNRMIVSEDRLEGVLAFNEKRKAQFKGR